MKLSDFINETLVEIAEGINRANRSLEGTGAMANPPNVYVQPEGGSKIFGVWDKRALEMHPIVELIEFDVALSVKEDRETNAKAGVSLSVLQLGTGGKSSDIRGSESRVKFRVPFIFPRAEP